MKKIITLSAMLFLLVGGLFAQKLSYQAVVRNSSNELVVNTALTVEVSVKDAANTVQYAETHSVTSNQNGLIVLTIGDGTVTQGTDLSAVNWEGATIESVIKNGGATVATISSPVNAVPYALQAANASGSGTFTETDPTVPAWAKEQSKPVYSYNEINGTPDLSGYLTSEADPTVFPWAKEPNKPTYNYSEIQNTPDMTTVNNGVLTITQGENTYTFSANTDQNVAIDVTMPEIPEVPSMDEIAGVIGNMGFLTEETQTLSDVAAYGNNAGNRQLKGLADPTDAQDAVTLGYLTAQLNALQQQLDQLSATVAAQQAVIDSLTNGGGGNDPVTPTTFTCGDNLVDGNNSYTTHQFGSQCWMTQNLRNASGTGTPSYPEVLQACPTGWHLPDNSDWSTLGSSLPSSSLDFGDGDYWASNTMPWSDGQIELTLFLAPASVRSNNVSINDNGMACEVNDALSGNCTFDNNRYPISVRCVREETGGGSTTQAPTVTTGSATAVTESGATLNATITNPDNVTITAQGFEYKVSGSNTSYTTVEGTGNGSSYTASLTGLTAGTEYTYHAVIAYNGTVTYGSEVTFTTTSAAPTTFTCGDNLIDGNNSYTTYQYGSQCWMTQNLRNANGTGSPSYPEVLTACPTGWHLPDENDWNTLGNYMSSLTNAPSLDFENGDYWTTSNSTAPWEDQDGNSFTLWYNWASVRTNIVTASAGNGVACEVNDALNCSCYIGDYCLAVRCVREETGGGSTTQAPTVTTGSATAVTESSATLNATITNPDNVTITAQGFEYKVSGSNTSYTTVEGTGNGSSYTASLTGLTAGTEYTYHAVIAYNGTVTYGSEVTFTTAEDNTPCPSLDEWPAFDGNNKVNTQILNYSAAKVNPAASGYIIFAGSGVLSQYKTITKSEYGNLVNITNDGYLECIIDYSMLQEIVGQEVLVRTFLGLVGCDQQSSSSTGWAQLSIPQITPATFTCGDNLIDGNNSYTTYQYGSQCWMTQNLRNSSGSDRIYYPEVLTACPTGWHLPSQDEWLTLGNNLPSYSENFGAGIYMTTNATMPWEDNDGNAFTLVTAPASVSNNNSVSIISNGLACEYSDIVNGWCYLDSPPQNITYLSVRCVRDNQ